MLSKVLYLSSYIYQGKHRVKLNNKYDFKNETLTNQIKVCQIKIMEQVSNKSLMVPWAKMVKSSKEGEWSQDKKWSRMELSTDGPNFVKS